ncbi:MAG: non-ribosomal peptide synthetase, partial [Pseudomonadota bacterium]|nr:non-ribosomal peptide synthetase [Pseudomonadota bacterium]
QPQAPALADGGGMLSYGEFNRRANRLARRLQQAGVTPGAAVGILLPRSNDALVALLAVLKAGAAYLALDPGYPAERLAYMLDDSGVRWVIGGRDAAAGVQRLDVEDPALATLPDHNLDRPLNPDLPAYAVYTSGSTGRPKAVEISHASLSHSTQLRLAFYPTPVRAYLLLSPLAFDSSVAGIFWTLAQGGLLVLPDTGEALAPDRLAALIRQYRVSHGLSLPSLYAALLDCAAPADLASLDTWIVAGETCREALAARHRQALPGVSLVNEYGPTEATVWACADVLDADSTAEGVSIGRPLPTMVFWLLNDQGAPAALGEPGEIHLGGPQLARGYRGRPEQTAAAFRQHPELPGSPRLYRTGDLARWRLDGRLRLLGRRDRQVKIRGFRVETGEIEQALLAHPQVAEAAVVAQTRHDHPRLAAYVAARQGNVTDVLRDYLAERLPPHLVPALWVAVDALPRHPNGKLDLHALPDPDRLNRQPLVAPRNPLEAALQAICAEVLRREVGVLDDFFRIGGDSILSLQLVARAMQRGIRISARQVFERRTIAALAEAAEWQSIPNEPAETGASTPGFDPAALNALLGELDDAQ